SAQYVSLSLHDALPISCPHGAEHVVLGDDLGQQLGRHRSDPFPELDLRSVCSFEHQCAVEAVGLGYLVTQGRLERKGQVELDARSVEHTSELQSREKLV